jgi:iron(III) transport system substrate-binding protein
MRSVDMRAPVLGLAALVALCAPVLGQAPPAAGVTAELVEAARKEGRVSFYTAVDVEVAERVKQAFEAKYRDIKVQVERSGAQRIFQRLGQEYDSSIFNADVINSSDAAHFVVWKRNGWLTSYVPDEVARHYDKAEVDPDGTFMTWKASLCVMGYNSKFVKPADAPRSYADLLAPKWKGMIVKAHPAYSGTILTATHEIAQALGWSYFDKLGTQKVMQVQSSTDSPKKLAIGERPIMADGTESNMVVLKDGGAPVEIIYPAEGTPYVPSPTAVLAKAPHPNAARLFQSFLYTVELQKMIVDAGGERSLHPLVKDRPGRPPLSEIKLMRADPAGVLDKVEEIKATYAKAFGT